MNKQVAENISARAKERAGGILTPQKIKTALVVQGGTLRSVASCGSAAALNYLKLTNAFDKVYGASSGSVNAAYFLTDQSALGVTVYTEDVNNRRFLNFFRLHKMIDLEFFFEEIVLKRKEHNYERLKNHPTELKIITTDLDSHETVWFSSKDDKVDVYAAMKASCALPVIYGRGVRVAGRRCVDGFIKEPMPLLTPFEHGYTDILVLMTRHISLRQTGKVPLFKRLLFEPLIKRQPKNELYELYRNRWKRYNWAVEQIEAGVYRRKDGHEIRIAYVCPDLETEVHKFELGAEPLLRAGYSAWKNTFDFFGVSEGSKRSDYDNALYQAKRRIGLA